MRTIYSLTLMCGALVLLSGPFSAPATAADMISLADWSKRPASTQVKSYPFVRCAGLWVASVDYAGTKRLGEKTADGFLDAAGTSAALAVLDRQEYLEATSEQERHFASQIVRREVERVRDLYLERMHTSFARSGQAIAGDTLITSDLFWCKDFLDGVYAANPELRPRR